MWLASILAKVREKVIARFSRGARRLEENQALTHSSESDNLLANDGQADLQNGSDPARENPLRRAHSEPNVRSAPVELRRNSEPNVVVPPPPQPRPSRMRRLASFFRFRSRRSNEFRAPGRGRSPPDVRRRGQLRLARGHPRQRPRQPSYNPRHHEPNVGLILNLPVVPYTRSSTKKSVDLEDIDLKKAGSEEAEEKVSLAMIAAVKEHTPVGRPEHSSRREKSTSASSSSGANDQCTVCMVNFKEGEQLRLLPCMHQYHRQCIDHWLFNFSNNCPICQHDVRKWD